MKNFIEKANKKAWSEIKKIQTANNMVEVEALISSALAKTFGIQHMGLIKIAMKNDNYLLQREYGCSTYNGNFDLLKSVRNYNFDTYSFSVRSYLIGFIPERMKSSHMYAKLAA